VKTKGVAGLNLIVSESLSQFVIIFKLKILLEMGKIKVCGT
jgi:hypothetical protein